MSKIIGYTRVSSDKQTTDNQKHIILEYAHTNKLKLDEIIETTVSSRKDKKHRLIDETLELLNDKDTLLVYSLDRLGRSTLETLQIIEEIKNKGIKLIFIKNNIIIDKHDTNPMNEMMLTLLAGFAQMERSFISERTKAGLARVKASGVKLGRKKGQQVKSMFDEHKDKIIELKELGVTNKRIHEYIKVGTVQSLGKYIKTRKIGLIPSSKKNIESKNTIPDAIDELYEKDDNPKKQIRKIKTDYYLKVIQKKYNKYGISHDYKNAKYEVIVLKNVVVNVNPEVYNEIFNEYSDDELLHNYKDTDLTTLLNNNDESSIVNGKIVVDIDIAEQNFRKHIFDNGYQTLQAKKAMSTQGSKNSEQEFDLNFPIKNEFEGMDFSGIK